jgi:HSP20 family protein
MAPERDIFANFERMRREMDEIFGEVLGGGAGLTPRRRGGFSPAVDVFYESEPPRAVVQAELAGIDPDEIGLEIDGRDLVLVGHRRPAESEGRVYQQLEIDFGPFRRTIPLGADVQADQARATYRDGMLRVELPLEQPEARTKRVPIEVPRDHEGGR